MDKLLKELSVAMKPCEQAERMQKAQQVRQQEWVKQRRDNVQSSRNTKRRRTSHHVHVETEDCSSVDVDSSTVVATSSLNSESAEFVQTDK
jgi:hypothetical protein